MLNEIEFDSAITETVLKKLQDGLQDNRLEVEDIAGTAWIKFKYVWHNRLYGLCSKWVFPEALACQSWADAIQPEEWQQFCEYTKNLA